MSDEAIRVEFKLPPTRKEPAPKPEPGAQAERWRRERAFKRARQLALAYWIDHLIRSGEVADLAAAALMCGVSRARLSRIAAMLGLAGASQDQILRPTQGTSCYRSIGRGQDFSESASSRSGDFRA